MALLATIPSSTATAHGGSRQRNLPDAERIRLDATDAELVVAIMALAAGELTEENWPTGSGSMSGRG